MLSAFFYLFRSLRVGSIWLYGTGWRIRVSLFCSESGRLNNRILLVVVVLNLFGREVWFEFILLDLTVDILWCFFPVLVRDMFEIEWSNNFFPTWLSRIFDVWFPRLDGLEGFWRTAVLLIWGFDCLTKRG